MADALSIDSRVALELGALPWPVVRRRGFGDLLSLPLCRSGSTHAWAEVYVPGAGWITFDPTNGSIGGFNLIPVAVARDIAHVVPVTGSFGGAADAFMSMTVQVSVTT